MIDGVVRHFGAIDALVNNAGMISVGMQSRSPLEPECTRRSVNAAARANNEIPG